MLMIGRSIHLPAAVITTGLLVLVIVLSQAMASAAQPRNFAVEAWPPFTMTYRETSLDQAGRPVTQLFRLDYIDTRHFTVRVVAHSTVPDAVGFTQTVDGTLSTTIDPRLGTRTSRLGGDERTVPAQWLVPLKVPPLAQRPSAEIIRLEQGLLRARVSESVDGRMNTTEITYRDDTGIPVLFVESVDGREVRRAEVVDLTIHRTNR